MILEKLEAANFSTHASVYTLPQNVHFQLYKTEHIMRQTGTMSPCFARQWLVVAVGEEKPICPE